MTSPLREEQTFGRSGYRQVRASLPLYRSVSCRGVWGHFEGAEHKKPSRLGEANFTAARRDSNGGNYMQRVLVLSSTRKPLMPCHPARARQLLRQGKAAIFRRYPFTIILKDREDGATQTIEVKIDPGSKTTGIALTAEFDRGKTVVWASEIEHRGQQVKKALEARSNVRRSRRNRKTRYRPARFNNRLRPEGWLPPSIMSRVHNVNTWALRIKNFAPVYSFVVETARFDTQKMQNPEISGVEYQQGDLLGYEVREYLLEKWQRRCTYCDKTGVSLEVEHIVPKSRGGSDRVSNLTLACRPCNEKKGNLTASEFGYPKVQTQAKQPLKDAAAINATRYAIGNMLKKHGLPISFWTGGRTKHNRTKQNYPKAHWIDAACTGETGSAVNLDPNMQILRIAAKGHGNRCMCATDKYGFPSRYRTNQKRHFGFQTGDIVRAKVPKGKYPGIREDRVTIRASGNFTIKTANKKVQEINHRYCSIIHRADGYQYLTVQKYLKQTGGG